MKTNVTILLFFVFLNCVLSQSKWNKINETNAQIEYQIDSSNWSYPWYIVKYGEGKFENTLGDTLSKQDTIKIYHNSNCESQVLTVSINSSPTVISKDILKYAGTQRSSDTVEIKIFDYSASNNEAIFIKIHDNKYNISYKKNYITPHKTQETLYKNHYLKLNNLNTLTDEIIIGELDISFIEFVVNEREEVAIPIIFQRRIFGKFKVDIE